MNCLVVTYPDGAVWRDSCRGSTWAVPGLAPSWDPGFKIVGHAVDGDGWFPNYDLTGSTFALRATTSTLRQVLENGDVGGPAFRATDSMETFLFTVGWGRARGRPQVDAPRKA